MSVPEPELPAARDPHAAEEMAREPEEHAPRITAPSVRLLHPRKNSVWLGVELLGRAPEHAGIGVKNVLRGSPAFGVLEEGDVILSIEGEVVNSSAELTRALHHHPVGAKVGVGFLRRNQTRLSSLVLEGAPEVEDRARLEWIGLEAPEIASVVTFQGETASLAEMRGKVVVLEFWAKYCGVCRMMAPFLDDWHRTLAPAGLRVVGITMDTPAEGAEAAAEARMSYPLASDPHGDITKAYHATQIPMLLIVDRRGVVRDVVVGYSTPRLQATEKLLDELLKEEAPAFVSN